MADILDCLPKEAYDRFIEQVEKDFGLNPSILLKYDDEQRYDWDTLLNEVVGSYVDEDMIAQIASTETLVEKRQNWTAKVIKYVADFLGKDKSEIDLNKPFAEYIPFSQRKLFSDKMDSDLDLPPFLYDARPIGCWCALGTIILLAACIRIILVQCGIPSIVIGIVCILIVVLAISPLSDLCDKYCGHFEFKNISEIVEFQADADAHSAMMNVIGNRILKILTPYLDEINRKTE